MWEKATRRRSHVCRPTRFNKVVPFLLILVGLYSCFMQMLLLVIIWTSRSCIDRHVRRAQSLRLLDVWLSFLVDESKQCCFGSSDVVACSEIIFKSLGECDVILSVREVQQRSCVRLSRMTERERGSGICVTRCIGMMPQKSLALACYCYVH